MILNPKPETLKTEIGEKAGAQKASASRDMNQAQALEVWGFEVLAVWVQGVGV